MSDRQRIPSELVIPSAVPSLRAMWPDELCLPIPYGRGRICPVTLTLDWFARIRDQEGPLFRPVRKGGNIIDQILSGEAVAKIVKQAARTLGLDPVNYSAHSLRSGFITSAIRAGAPSQFVRKQTGHASEATMARYVRLGNLFTENAVSWLL